MFSTYEWNESFCIAYEILLTSWRYYLPWRAEGSSLLAWSREVVADKAIDGTIGLWTALLRPTTDNFLVARYSEPPDRLSQLSGMVFLLWTWGPPFSDKERFRNASRFIDITRLLAWKSSSLFSCQKCFENHSSLVSAFIQQRVNIMTLAILNRFSCSSRELHLRY